MNDRHRFDPQVAEMSAQVDAADGGQPAKKESRRVLVVDDSAIVRHTVTEILKRLGCEVHEAENGESALKLLEAEPVDLVILDIHMPVKGGFETLEELRANPRFTELPVFVLTSSASQDFVRKAASLKIAGYLLKSELNPRDLGARIGTVVGRVEAMAPSKPAASLSLRILFAHSSGGAEREILKLLADWGCTIMPTDDGEEALTLIRQGEVDVVLIEDQLATGDGYSLAKELRSTGGGDGNMAPIVLVTDKPLEEIKEFAESSGMDAYIAKPVDAQRLFKTLKDLSTLESGAATLFDRAELMERAGEELDLVHRMLDLFFRDAPGLLDKAGQAIADQSGEELGDHAHTLKGMLATLAAHETAKYAELLERIGRSGDLSKATTALQRLGSGVDDLSAQLNAEFER